MKPLGAPWDVVRFRPAGVPSDTGRHALGSAKHGCGPLNLEAALAAEILTSLQPKVSRHWNNLGLFLRDHADELRARQDEADREAIRDLCNRAYNAYQQALALEPENPNYLNDTALMLQYYLRRDLSRATSMYRKAIRCAEELLAREDLPDDRRAVVEIALRDARDNSSKLESVLPGGSGPGPR